MRAEGLAVKTGVAEPERGGGLRLPALLLLAGVATGALAVVRPQLAASAGAAALVSAGAAVAMRGRRRGPSVPRPEPGATFMRAGPGLNPDAPLAGLLDSLATALNAAVAVEWVEMGAGPEWPDTISHPDGDTRERLRRLARERGEIVPAPMRTAEACVLNGAAAANAGGLASWAAAGAALTLPVRGKSGRILGWLLVARSGAGAELGNEEVSLSVNVAVLAGLLLDSERLRQEAGAGLGAQSDFLAVMSHELKTPLNVIIGYADLMLMGLPEAVPPGARHNVERLRGSARDLEERIEEILTYVRVAGGGAAPDEERVRADAGALLREAAVRMEPLARAKGLTFVVRTPPAAVLLCTYPEALGRVLELILSNAVKFTYEGGIEAELVCAQATTRLRIRDTGIGMSADQLEHIFEPFWQANPRATRRERGLGLGLTTARALARALGGDIAVESVPGAGSTVTISLAGPETTPATAG